MWRIDAINTETNIPFTEYWFFNHTALKRLAFLINHGYDVKEVSRVKFNLKKLF